MRRLSLFSLLPPLSRILAFTFAFSMVMPLYAENHPQYTVTDLGPIGYVSEEYDFSQAQVFRVNDAGLVIGSSEILSLQQAIVFPSGSTAYVELPDYTDEASAASGMNGQGDIVGWTNISGLSEAALWQFVAGSWQLSNLPLLNGYSSSRAWDINDNGVIVGSLNDGEKHYAAYWPNATAQPILLGDGSGFEGEAFALNNSAIISGVQGPNVKGEPSSSFRWQVGDLSETLLPLISDDVKAITSWGGADINNSGLIVGGANALISNPFSSYPVTHPFVWSASAGIEDLLPLFSSTAWANNINDAGYVVGETIGRALNQPQGAPTSPVINGKPGRIPFVYRQETDDEGNTNWQEYLLWDQIPEEDRAVWHFYKASGISNVGRIVGLGGKLVGEDYAWHAYMLTPAVADLSVTQTTLNTVVVPKPLAKPLSKYLSNPKVFNKANQGANPAAPSQIEISVSNHGPLAATDIQLNHVLDAKLSIDSIDASSGTCESTLNVDNNTLLDCVFAGLAVNEVGKIILKISSDTTGDYPISISVSANESDSLNSANNQLNKTINVQGQASSTPDDPSSAADTSSDASTNEKQTSSASAISLHVLILLMLGLWGIRRRYTH